MLDLGFIRGQAEDCAKRNRQRGYNEGVDDFANRMIIMMPGHKQDILHVAEQLKHNEV